jgi:iron complex transport system substrate-binding protein
MNKNCLIFGLLLFIAACKSKPVTTEMHVHCIKENTLQIKYAKGFTVDYYNGFKVISVRNVRDTSKIIAQYVLFPEGKPAPADFQNAIKLCTPAKKIICISTNHIAQMAALNLMDSISGVANTSLIYNGKISANIKNGSLTDLGNEELNYEKIIALKPWFVFTSGSWDGADKVNAKLQSLKIPSVSNLDFMEQQPLARAEWIKFVAAFYDKEVEADSIFTALENNYTTLKLLAGKAKFHPTVFFNLPYKEIWYMPCRENYMTNLVADAGGNFLWGNEKSTTGFNLSLDYEAVYNKAANADYWINTGFVKSLADLKSTDKKNTFFKAYKAGKVFNNDRRTTNASGFDFWESGTTNPDKILADLIFILHPELLPNHQLYYYRQLK